jgi:hypothetical protein
MRLLVTAHTAFVKSMEWQDHGYKTGLALSRHTESAHEGKIDPHCRACSEIQAKMVKEKKIDVKQASEVPAVL